MNKFVKAFKRIPVTLKKNSPTVLTIFAVSGVIGTAVLAVKATPKAVILIETNSKRNHEGDPKAATNMEKVKSCWRVYVPAAVMGASTIACIIGANSINVRRNAALASAYAITESALTNYKNEVVEKLGKETADDISHSVNQKQVDETGKESIPIVISNDEYLCRDSISGRYFSSSIEKLRAAENRINNQLLHDGEISLNQVYDEIGLPEIKIGDILYWYAANSCDMVEFSFDSCLYEGKPCIVLDYKNDPVTGEYHTWY